VHRGNRKKKGRFTFLSRLVDYSPNLLNVLLFGRIIPLIEESSSLFKKHLDKLHVSGIGGIMSSDLEDALNDGHGKLARTSHHISSRGGADGRGYKARDEGPRRHT
jgi:hypothetical protein